MKIKYLILLSLVFLFFSCKKKDTEETKPDTTPPVINLLGSASVNVNKGDLNYKDAGATATDDVDGDITSKIVVDNPVDVNTLGTYTVKYNVSDVAGNKAVEKTRTVKVLIY